MNGIYRRAIPKKQFVPFTTLEGVEFEKSMQFYKKLGDINGVDYSMLVAKEEVEKLLAFNYNTFCK